MSNVVGLDGEPIEQEPAPFTKANMALAAHFTSLAEMAANGDITSYVGAIMMNGGPVSFRSGLKADMRDTFALMGIMAQTQSDMAEAIRLQVGSEDLDGYLTEPDGAA